MVFVMRVEPAHIVISAQQMWNKAMQRNGWRQTPASPGSVLKEYKSFPSFALYEVSFPPAPAHQGLLDLPTPLLQDELCSGLSAAVLGQHGRLPDRQQPQTAPLSLSFGKSS